MALASVAALIAAHFAGQIPTATLVAGSRAEGGSGNPGASNVYRQAGARAGVVVFAGDAAKGAAAVALGLVVGSRGLAAACGLAAAIGHCYPALRRFKGGKGVATAAGVVAVLAPFTAAVGIATWLVVVRLTKTASTSSLVAVVVSALSLAVFRPSAEEAIALGALGALILIRHLSNIQRLIRGQERSIAPGGRS